MSILAKQSPLFSIVVISLVAGVVWWVVGIVNLPQIIVGSFSLQLFGDAFGPWLWRVTTWTSILVLFDVLMVSARNQKLVSLNWPIVILFSIVFLAITAVVSWQELQYTAGDSILLESAQLQVIKFIGVGVAYAAVMIHQMVDLKSIRSKIKF